MFLKIITNNKPMEYSKPAKPKIKNELDNSVKSSLIDPVKTI